MIKVLTLLAILTVSTAFSQGITDQQKLEAVRNAQRVESLSNELGIAYLKISVFEEKVANFDIERAAFELKNNLIQNNYDRLEARYEALAALKDDKYTFVDFLTDLGLVAAGIIIGAVAVAF